MIHCVLSSITFSTAYIFYCKFNVQLQNGAITEQGEVLVADHIPKVKVRLRKYECEHDGAQHPAGME